MDIAGLFSKRMLSAATVMLCAGGLSGCFDLEQKVAVRSDGSGTYKVILTANGIVGEGLDKKHADIDFGDERAVTKVVRKDDTTVQTSEVDFQSLSDLKLGDEKLSLHVKGKKLLGLGPTEVNFHRTFHIDHGRRYRDDDDDDDMHWGRSVLHSIFGDHTYKFSVWLPGKIERIAPLRVADRVVHPTVWSDKYGHTVIWTMNLSDMLLADQVDFDVDFAAHGDFKDAQSAPGVHRHRLRHRHRHDDDDDDDDAS